MARMLALETSGRTGSVALAQDDQILAERSFEYGLQNAARMLPLIDELCRSHHFSPRDISRIAVSIGPGSFTGLRIGVTLAKTLAFATGAAVIPVQSVQVLAANAPPEAKEVIIVLDAKRAQIFTARLRREGKHWIEFEPPHLDTLAGVLGRAGRPVYLIGEGIPQHRRSISEDSEMITTDESRWIAHASIVARLASHGDAIEPEKLLPLYLRKAEAEEKADARIAQSISAPLDER